MRAETKWIYFFLLTALAPAQQIPPQQNAPASVEGRVIQAATREPVRKAHVTLGSSASASDSELVATTDEQGNFRFAEVRPGTYQLIAEKTGFLPGGYLQKGPGDDETLLKIGPGDRLENLTLRLFPAASISGRVLDADGDPAAGYQVILWAQHRRTKNAPYSPSDQGTTNRDGEYRFEGLEPGTYSVSAGKESAGFAVRQIPVDREGRPTKIQELWTFFPAALSRADAQVLKLESGQEQSGADIHIQRGPLLTVKGSVAGIDSPSKYSVSAGVEEGLGWTSESAKVLANGEFVVELPPGKHTLSLLEPGGSGLREVGATEVNLADHDVSGVVITRFRPALVRVRVVIEGEEDKPLTIGSVSLIPEQADDSSTLPGPMQYQPQNGVYILDNVRPGKYRVWFNNATGSYLKSVQSGGQSLESSIVDVTEGANLDLLMTYSRNVAKLSGEVEVAEDPPEGSFRVLLISEDPALTGRDNPRIGQLDQSHHFVVEHMAPGRYLAFASQEDDFDVWDNADFVKSLKPEGIEIELHEKENATVHLKLIPKDETDRIRRQLGI